MAKTIYIEGGGDSDALKTECRQAFTKFFEAAGLKGKMPRLVACGSRNTAFDKFKTALNNGQDALLLVDSESPVLADPQADRPISPWKHLKERDGWDCPDSATDDYIHLMVQCMESWFVADKTQFVAYYSKGNRQCTATTIPDCSDVEGLDKKSVLHYLDKASLPSGKEKYSKGSRSFEILATIRPEKVANASYHFRRLCYALGVTDAWVVHADFNAPSL
jgi:Domain of unknown function (DUF4276)